jgi:hypothetical protein
VIPAPSEQQIEQGKKTKTEEHIMAQKNAL